MGERIPVPDGRVGPSCEENLYRVQSCSFSETKFSKRFCKLPQRFQT